MVLLQNEKNTLPLSSAASVAIIGKAGSTAPKVETNTTEGVAPYIVSPLEGIRKRSNGKVTSYDGADPSAAAEAAGHADNAIVFVQTNESEGDDRNDLSLPDNQDALIAAVAAANPRTIVVLNTGGAVLMPWLDRVAGLIQGWYPGQEEGNALAAILYGDVNPSAKLPLSFPRSASAVPLLQKEQWPGVDGHSEYSEKLNVGYRWYDSTNTKPLFPFGFGLSYTTFQLSRLVLEPTKLALHSSAEPAKLAVHVDVTNTGKRAGPEVVQVYVGHPAGNNEPPHQLRAFAKVQLAPGETKAITLKLDARSFSIFDTGEHQWTTRSGRYDILVGTSSRDLPLHATITAGHADPIR
jgi:beta-glucosidase